jgi:hypothetical protein
MTSMRRFIALALSAVAFTAAFPAAAQQSPPRLEPIPDVPPPPIGVSDAEPQVRTPVTIVPGESERTETKRDAGQSRMHVTPADGVPYDLVEDADTSYKRNSLDSGVRVPQFTIFRFD